MIQLYSFILMIGFFYSDIYAANSEEIVQKYGLPKGATPLESRQGLKDPKLKNRFQLYTAENTNLQNAQNKYFHQNMHPREWFSENYLKQIHRDMLGDVWVWAGEYYSGRFGIWAAPKPRG